MFCKKNIHKIIIINVKNFSDIIGKLFLVEISGIHKSRKKIISGFSCIDEDYRKLIDTKYFFCNPSKNETQYKNNESEQILFLENIFDVDDYLINPASSNFKDIEVKYEFTEDLDFIIGNSFCLDYPFFTNLTFKIYNHPLLFAFEKLKTYYKTIVNKNLLFALTTQSVTIFAFIIWDSIKFNEAKKSNLAKQYNTVIDIDETEVKNGQIISKKKTKIKLKDIWDVVPYTIYKNGK